MPFWAGLGLAPFAAGLGAVIALGAFPGAAHGAHLVFVFLWLAAIALAGWLMSRGSVHPPVPTAPPILLASKLLLCLVALWAVVLIVNTLFLPLFQNDPLEYATVGRLLFEKRDLAFYPAIAPGASDSGFYGPWTHPPLYVAQIYLTQLIQGHADSPGLMRLIAPWYALVATGVVYAMGCLVNRLTGAMAAMVFISTPLFILGADSALIDPLPVLGFALILATVLGLEGRAMVRGALIGVALGLALWTHSQAILFAPLAVAAIFLSHGLKGWRTALGQSAAMLLAGFVIAGWPYLRNIAIFGSPISDNPQVFAAEGLGWDAYFRFARGLDTWAAIVQYGILKGWFALEAFGWSFWLAAAGMVIFLTGIFRRGLAAVAVFDAAALGAPMRVLWVGCGLIVTYIAGVSASVLIGTELVRNERYLLIMLPAVSVVGGYGLASILEWAAAADRVPAPSRLRKGFFAAMLTGLTAVILLQVYLVGWYYRWVNPWPQQAGANPSIQMVEPGQSRFDRLLGMRANTRVVQMMAAGLPADAVVLSLIPADMYYSGRRMISYLDPRMLPLYLEEDPAAMARGLTDLGATHILIPDYYLPPINNSALQEVVASPELTTLEFGIGGTQVYSLAAEKRGVAQAQPIQPGAWPWTRYPRLTIGGRKALSGIALAAEVMDENRASVTDQGQPWFHRDFSTVLSLGLGPDDCATACSKDIESLPQIEGGQQYRLTLDLVGEGFVKIRLMQYDDAGPAVAQAPDNWITPLADLALVESQGLQTITRRFNTLSGARRLGIQVEHMGHSTVKIERALLERLEPSRTSSLAAKP